MHVYFQVQDYVTQRHTTKVCYLRIHPVILLDLSQHGQEAVHLVGTAVVTGDVTVAVDVRQTAVDHHVGRVRVNGWRGRAWRETPGRQSDQGQGQTRLVDRHIRLTGL